MSECTLDQLPVNTKIVRICTTDSPLVPSFLFECHLDSYIEKRIANEGYWEPAYLNFALLNLKPGDAVIDVGGNVGAYSVPLALAVGTTGAVVAFEPVPFLAERLRQNLALNNLGPTVQVVPAAVSDKKGRATFFVPTGDNMGLGGLTLNNDCASQHKTIDVDVVTLDDYLPTVLAPDRKITLIKLDIQGAEPAALRGAAATIAKHRPRILLEFEVAYHADFASVATGLKDFLSGLGYGLFVPSPPVLVEFNPRMPYDGGLIALPMGGRGPSGQTV